MKNVQFDLSMSRKHHLRLARLPYDAIFVARDRRGTGVASALMRAAESWALERGAVGMDLSVYEFNEDAREAFTAMGYETLHRRMSKPASKPTG